MTDQPPGDNRTASWARGFRMLKAYRAAGIPRRSRWSQIKKAVRPPGQYILQPHGYYKGLAAIKNLSAAAKVTEQQAKDWLKNQAIWNIYLPAPRHIPRPKVDVAVPNEVHKADLLFLPQVRDGRKIFRYALMVVDVASRYKEVEPLD